MLLWARSRFPSPLLLSYDTHHTHNVPSEAALFEPTEQRVGMKRLYEYGVLAVLLCVNKDIVCTTPDE